MGGLVGSTGNWTTSAAGGEPFTLHTRDDRTYVDVKGRTYYRVPLGCPLTSLDSCWFDEQTGEFTTYMTWAPLPGGEATPNEVDEEDLIRTKPGA